MEVINIPPKAVVREAAFREKAVDMRIPFKRSSEGMEDTDKAGDKVFGFIEGEKHTEDNAADSLKETV